MIVHKPISFYLMNKLDKNRLNHSNHSNTTVFVGIKRFDKNYNIFLNICTYFYNLTNIGTKY